MSEEDDFPQGNEPTEGDPTQIHIPYQPEADATPFDATTMGEPVPPYDPAQDPSIQNMRQSGEPAGDGTKPPTKNSLVAPLITVALVSILIGIGLGYLLFHNSSSSSSSNSTTTTSEVTTTTSTTVPSTTSTTAATTSTTKKPVVTTTTVVSTSTTSAKTSSTTSTTRPTTTSTTAANTTNGLLLQTTTTTAH